MFTPLDRVKSALLVLKLALYVCLLMCTSPVAPVQKWKMVVLIFIALGSMGYVIPVLWIMPIYHHTLGYVSALLFATSLSVTCTVFVTIPLLLMLLRRWVFAPWTESPSAFVRVLQKGFPCWA